MSGVCWENVKFFCLLRWNQNSHFIVLCVSWSPYLFSSLCWNRHSYPVAEEASTSPNHFCGCYLLYGNIKTGPRHNAFAAKISKQETALILLQRCKKRENVWKGNLPNSSIIQVPSIPIIQVLFCDLQRAQKPLLPVFESCVMMLCFISLCLSFPWKNWC